MLRNLDRFGRSVVFVSVLVAVLLVGTGIGTAAAQSAPDCSTVTYNGDGTAASPFEVSNVSQLQCVNQDLDANYRLVSDIDAFETSIWNNGDGFAPVGERGSGTKFNGTFDGAGHEIDDLAIDRQNEDDIGLLGFVGPIGEVRKVSVSQADVAGDRDVGTLVGENEGTVEAASASGSVGGGFPVGGLVGKNKGTVRDSSASADVTGSDAGGLVGNNEEGIVRDSSASGTVQGTSNIVGGLVGFNEDGIVRNSSASGDVTSSGFFLVGGLVGFNENSIVRNSSASGDAEGGDDVGGLVGANDEGTVRGSSASGDVEGGDDVGGLVGTNDEGTVRESSASGNIEGDDLVGGLVGTNQGTVERASSTGNATGNTSVGGLVGRNQGTVEDSYARGGVSGFVEFVGGLVGRNGESGDPGAIETSYATGEVTGPLPPIPIPGPFSDSDPISTQDTSTAGGLIGNNTAGTVTNSYWDVNTTGFTVSDGGTGLTTAEMNGSDAGDNMDGFDFTDTWETVTNPDDYPILTWETQQALFTDALPGFNAPPTNTQQLDNTLYEDISGDGDGLDPSQSVTLWTELVLNPDAFNDLTQEQIDALDWNGDGQLTPADVVSLWTEQVLN